MQPLTITAADGYLLSALYATPAGKYNGALIISSATGVKKEFYLNFAKFLVQQGYHVLLFDYRGVGGSAPPNLKSCNAFMHEWGTKDMNAALDYMVEERKLTGITWLGHSIGGQLAGLLHNRQHIKQLIAVNAAVGYWGYFPFPMNLKIWTLWYIIGPLLIQLYGYGTMRKIGWGEDLPRNVILEWRRWCLSKNYFARYLQQHLRADKFYRFNKPVTAVYTSDDFICNDRTISRMMQFFPNAPVQIIKIHVHKYSKHPAGHTGLFRKRFEKNLWPLLLAVIETNTENKNDTATAAVLPVLQ